MDSKPPLGGDNTHIPKEWVAMRRGKVRRALHCDQTMLKCFPSKFLLLCLDTLVSWPKYDCVHQSLSDREDVHICINSSQPPWQDNSCHASNREDVSGVAVLIFLIIQKQSTGKWDVFMIPKILWSTILKNCLQITNQSVGNEKLKLC